MMNDASFLSWCSQCLSSAVHVYSLAASHQQCEVADGQLLTVSPFDYYPENEWCSDMELAAVQLHKAGAIGEL